MKKNRPDTAYFEGLPPEPRAPQPPPGTYPPPDFEGGEPYRGDYQPPYFQPEPPRKTHRVGRFTAALALIFVGIVLVMQLFFRLDYLFLAKLSPLLLVVLGGEILLSTLLDSEARLKYDLLGLFVSAILIGGCLVVAVVPQYLINQEQHYDTVLRLTSELESQSYERLKDSSLDIEDLSWYIDRYSGISYLAENASIADIDSNYRVQFRVYFSRRHDSAEAFAADCKAVLDELRGLVPEVSYASFYDYDYDNSYESDLPHYQLVVGGVFQLNMTAAELAQRVEATYYTEYGYFGSIDEYERFLNELAQQEEAVYEWGAAVYADGYYFLPDGRVVPEYEDMPSYEEFLAAQDDAAQQEPDEWYEDDFDE